MGLKKPVNENYCATVVEVKNIIPLDNCDNVQHCSIFGNLVIVSKDTKVGDKGLFFPVECKLSDEYLSANNLFRHSDKNADNTKKGYFEDNGRIKCMKFRGHRSMGIFMPMSSLDFIDEEYKDVLAIDDSFDELNGTPICTKYVVVRRNTGGHGGGKGRRAVKVSRLVDNQFRLHQDTDQLGRNLFKIYPDQLIQISTKVHGTSFVVGKVLCKKRLGIAKRIMRFIGIDIVDTEYDTIVSSRRVIKNDDMAKDHSHFYDEDIWTIAGNQVKDTLVDGMTYYGEIVGYTSAGSYIQKDYDYGCEQGEHKIFIYRITYTNASGHVFEFSAKQVRDWCTEQGLNPVHEEYYGRVNYVKDKTGWKQVPSAADYTDLEDWRTELLEFLSDEYLEGDSVTCKNKVPEEGVVLRVEGPRYEAYKLKAFRFLEKETKDMDKGESNIEDDQTEEVKSEV